MTTKTVNLRNLPEDLVRRAKACAAWQGISLKEFIVRAVRQALEPAERAAAGAFLVTASQHRKRRVKLRGQKIKFRR